jgi:hypothetical protein
MKTSKATATPMVAKSRWQSSNQLQPVLQHLAAYGM